MSFRRQNPGHSIHLWFDQHTLAGLDGAAWLDGMILHDVGNETWDNGDLLEEATNYAMMSDIVRLEVVYRWVTPSR